MRITLRIPQVLVDAVVSDLRRPHKFAAERVGFVYCKSSLLPTGRLLLAYQYEPIRDEQYIRDDTVGARFDSSSIREAMQFVLQHQVTAFHVHLHDHPGIPRFGTTDTREMKALMPCFVNVCPDCLHGALVLSADSAVARVWGTETPESQAVQRITFVGSPMRFVGTAHA